VSVKRARMKVFVGTSTNATESEHLRAMQMVAMLLADKFVPVSAAFYQIVFLATPDDIQDIKMSLLADCAESIWMSEPTDEEKEFMRRSMIKWRVVAAPQEEVGYAPITG
jgi:hypothetical protein